MKSCAVVLIFLVVLILIHAGSTYKLTLICKNELKSRAPFPCKHSRCDQFCANLNPNGWGKCRYHDHYVCQCFYICYKHISPPEHTNPNLPAHMVSSSSTPTP